MAASRTIFLAKLVLLPLGVGTLLYWASQEHSLPRAAAWTWQLSTGIALSQLAALPLALRFRHALKIAGFMVDVAHSLRINALSAFYHFFVPLSIGSELTKFLQLRAVAPEQGAMRAAGAILLDHLLGFAALLAILVTLMVAKPPLPFRLDSQPAGLVLLAAALAAATVAWRFRSRLLPLVREVSSRIEKHRADACQGFLWSVVMQAILAAAVLLGSSAWHIEISYLEILFVIAASSTLSALPVNVAGIGAGEIASTGLYMALGLSSKAALLLVSLLFSYRLLLAIIGGVWDFLATRRPTSEN